MKFLAITLITHVADPVTGIQKSTTERLRDVVENAVLAEELGFDGYGVGERHERPFISAEDETPLRAGMTFTDEPSIIIPGRFSVRIEDIVVCEEGGGRKLNSYPTALVANV